MRTEYPDVYAAGPQSDVSDLVRRELFPHALGRHHHARRPGMEGAQISVRPAFGNRKARAHVFRELGVIRSGEGLPGTQTPRTPRLPQRPLSGDMDRVRPELVEGTCHRAPGEERQADFRIGRAGNRPECLRCHRESLVPQLLQARQRAGQRGHDAVGLGPPGISDQRYPQAARSSTESNRSRCSAQFHSDRRPLRSSTTQLQLSIQSPSLQYRTPWSFFSAGR